MPFPNKLRGRRAWDLMKETAADTGIRRTVCVATMNALAEMCWERRPLRPVQLRVGVDAYDAAEIAAGEKLVVVGAFVPFLKLLKRVKQCSTVLERDPATLNPDEGAFFRPANGVAPVPPDADRGAHQRHDVVEQRAEGQLAL